MILYKVIKYTILDICINTLLEGIVFNLIKKSRYIEAKDIVEGMFFSKIIHLNMTWENCRIIRKQLKRYDMNRPRDNQDPRNKSYSITFQFTKTTAPFAYATDTEDRKYDTITIGPDTYFIT